MSGNGDRDGTAAALLESAIFARRVRVNVRAPTAAESDAHIGARGGACCDVAGK